MEASVFHLLFPDDTNFMGEGSVVVHTVGDAVKRATSIVQRITDSEEFDACAIEFVRFDDQRTLLGSERIDMAHEHGWLCTNVRVLAYDNDGNHLGSWVAFLLLTPSFVSDIREELGL